jgi:hypothetical protein
LKYYNSLFCGLKKEHPFTVNIAAASVDYGAQRETPSFLPQFAQTRSGRETFSLQIFLLILLFLSSRSYYPQQRKQPSSYFFCPDDFFETSFLGKKKERRGERFFSRLNWRYVFPVERDNEDPARKIVKINSRAIGTDIALSKQRGKEAF